MVLHDTIFLPSPINQLPDLINSASKISQMQALPSCLSCSHLLRAQQCLTWPHWTHFRPLLIIVFHVTAKKCFKMQTCYNSSMNKVQHPEAAAGPWSSGLCWHSRTLSNHFPLCSRKPSLRPAPSGLRNLEGIGSCSWNTSPPFLLTWAYLFSYL